MPTNTDCNNEFQNDVTIYGNVVGMGRYISLTNSNNTNPASDAIVQIAVGGAAGGDPRIEMYIGAVSAYQFGIDNSDADKLKISTAFGASDYMICTAGGTFTYPRQPSFQAAADGLGINNITGDGTVYTPLLAEVNDIGGNYDPATGIFTAPVAGRYFFNCFVTLTALGAAHTQLLLRGELIGVGGCIQQLWINPFNCSSGGSLAIATSGIATLAAGDRVSIQFSVSGGAKTVGFNGGSFQGYLLG